MSWLQLTNKTAIVTGAASGIGRATAKLLHEAGCRVVGVDVDGDSETMVCDVTNRLQVDAIMEQHKDATILVNCAGITRDSQIQNLSETDWDTVMDINLKGTFTTCQSFLRSEKKSGASIVNLASVVATQGNFGQANYGASKGGVLGLTKSLAKEVARNNIRVNAVLPGFIETPMTQQVPHKVLENTRTKIALRRFGRPEDVANLIAFLVSDRAEYITGAAIECSGMISL